MAMACPKQARCLRVPVHTTVGEIELDVEVWYEQHVQKEPLYFLVGGPGQSGVDASSYIAPLLQGFDRAIVFFSPLGTQKDGPFPCDRTVPTLRDLFDDSIAKRCVPKDNFSVQDYSSIQNVHYLNTIREELNHTRIVLLGSSYGSRIVQLYMQYYPQYVEQVILDSGIPLDAYIGVSEYAEEVFRKRLNDRGTKAFEDTLVSLPVEIQVFDPSLHEYVSLSMDRDNFFLLLHRTMYRISDQESLNHMMNDAARGDWTGFMRVAKEALQDQYSLGTYLSVFCQEDWTGLCSQEPNARFPFCIHLSKQCTQWPKPERFPSFIVKKSTISTLILHGSWDHIAPVSYAKRLQEQLGGTRVELFHQAHGVSLTRCGREVIREFLRKKKIDVHLFSCKKEMHIEH